jgi:hypothetical protein
MIKKKAFFMEPLWPDVTYQFSCHNGHGRTTDMVPQRFGQSIGMKPYNNLPKYRLRGFSRVISERRCLFLGQAVGSSYRM